jgi:gliding motility-associated-like protein
MFLCNIKRNENPEAMKAAAMTRTMITLMMVMMMAVNVFSQETPNDNNTYRVVAFKKGDNAVASVSNTVEVVLPTYLYVPTAFTPDGDGLNDTFAAKGQGIADFSIQIFNRWGAMIYESSDMQRGWDGTFKSEPVEAGTYVYIISAKSSNGKTFQKSGSITIVGTTQS